MKLYLGNNQLNGGSLYSYVVIFNYSHIYLSFYLPMDLETKTEMYQNLINNYNNKYIACNGTVSNSDQILYLSISNGSLFYHHVSDTTHTVQNVQLSDIFSLSNCTVYKNQL